MNEKSDQEKDKYKDIEYIGSAGKIGGEMVRRMIKQQEENMVKQDNYIDQLK